MHKKVLFAIVTLFWVAIIFSFSMQPSDVSGNISGSLASKIAELFLPALLAHPKQLEMLDFIVRKCAHFTEFMVLGVLSAFTLQYTNLKMKMLAAIEFCVVVATIDETIQLFFNGRAGQVQDVLLDSFGALAGILVVVLWRR